MSQEKPWQLGHITVATVMQPRENMSSSDFMSEIPLRLGPCLLTTAAAACVHHFLLRDETFEYEYQMQGGGQVVRMTAKAGGKWWVQQLGEGITQCQLVLGGIFTMETSLPEAERTRHCSCIASHNVIVIIYGYIKV